MVRGYTMTQKDLRVHGDFSFHVLHGAASAHLVHEMTIVADGGDDRVADGEVEHEALQLGVRRSNGSSADDAGVAAHALIGLGGCCSGVRYGCELRDTREMMSVVDAKGGCDHTKWVECHQTVPSTPQFVYGDDCYVRVG